MNLPQPPTIYDIADQSRTRKAIEMEDKRNLKVGTVFDKILVRDTDTGEVVTVTVASGVLVVTT
jgi:hypothetical protein